MAQEIIPRLLVLRRRLSALTQLLLIAAVVLIVGLAVLFWPAIQKNVANQSQHAQAARADARTATTDRALENALSRHRG